MWHYIREHLREVNSLAFLAVDCCELVPFFNGELLGVNFTLSAFDFRKKNSRVCCWIAILRWMDNICWIALHLWASEGVCCKMFHGKSLSSEHGLVLPIELTGFRGFAFGFCLEDIFIKFQRWGQFLTLFPFSILHYFVYLKKMMLK